MSGTDEDRIDFSVGIAESFQASLLLSRANEFEQSREGESGTRAGHQLDIPPQFAAFLERLAGADGLNRIERLAPGKANFRQSRFGANPRHGLARALPSRR